MSSISDVEKQIKQTLENQSNDFDGAQELIDAHLDEVSGGSAEFSLHVKFGREAEVEGVE